MKETTAVAAILGIVALWMTLIVGWFANLAWLFVEGGAADTTHFIIGLAGTVVAPVGAINGWLYIF